MSEKINNRFLDSSFLKGLRSQLGQLLTKSAIIKEEIQRKQREKATVDQDITNINKRITDIESDKTIRVSEHAIIRYLERVKGLDRAEIEKEIIDSGIINMVETLGGNGGYPHSSGKFTVKMSNYTVTTIVN